MGETELDVVRQMIQHEDSLRDQRLGWLFALNGFLFTALGLAWGDASSTSLVLIIAAVAIVVAVSTAAAMYASRVAIGRLGDLVPVEQRDLIMGLRSRDLEARGGVAAYVPKLYPWRVIPWCLAVAWAATAVVRILR